MFGGFEIGHGVSFWVFLRLFVVWGFTDVLMLLVLLSRILFRLHLLLSLLLRPFSRFTVQAASFYLFSVSWHFVARRPS